MSTPTLGRKEKLSTSVRSALNEQLAKLQIKHLAEQELLDEIRSFMKQRAQLDRDYSQGIQRLVQQFQNKREIKSPPDVLNFDRLENRGIMEVWKCLLDKTEELGKRRSAVADLICNSILDDLKVLRREKDQAFKRCSEIAQVMISEVLESVRGLTTTKKLYNERWKMCEEVRQKFQDADDRLRTSQLKLFESKAALERTQKKTGDKLKAAQKHLVVQRNEYLLSLAQTNTHLTKHFETDLPEVIKAIDGELYDKVRNSYMLYAQIEADCCNAVKADCEDLREKAALVNREYVLECFITENPILRDKIAYQFEPCGTDKVTTISKDHEAELYLNKEARKWAQELTRLHQIIADKNKTIKGLQSVTQAYHVNPEFGTSDAVTEAQQNLLQIQEEIRKIEVNTTKANARLDLLRDNGIDVNKWLQQAAHTGAEYVPGEYRPQEKTSSQPDLLDLNSSLRTQKVSASQLSLPGDSDTASLKSDLLSLNSYQSEPTPNMCVVLYSYEAQRDDELNIQTDEELDVLEWDDGDGWCKGRNKSGKEGFFPQSYVQAISLPSSPQLNICPSASTSVSISITTEGDAITGEVMLRALYEYTAQDEEELSFPEGAVIRLLRTDDNGVDDGWWEGIYEGKKGVFPSLVVEVISGDINQIGAELTPVSSEVFPFSAVSSSSPLPPPNYPAPEISTEDLSIPPLRPSLGSTPSLVLRSSPGPPARRPLGTSSTASSPGIYRGSAVVSEKRDQSDNFHDSFEDTLQNPENNNWSSFEDVNNDDDSYV